MIKNPAFYFNSELCTGCKACMIACIDKHNLNKGVLWRRVLEYSGGEWLPVGDAYEQNVFAYGTVPTARRSLTPNARR